MDGDQILEPNLYTIKALLILDSDGERLIAKYFDDTFGSVKEQKSFERNLFAKTTKASGGEIILIDGLTCVYRSNVELFFYVAGSSQENEIILTQVLNCLYESVQTFLGKAFEKRNFLDNLDSAFLVVDEIVDGGVICELDSDVVTQRASIRHSDEQIPLGEQTVAQVLQSAKEQLKWSLLK
ncbi:Coatomer subunit zeta-1 [Hypsibius exemplaris]|uniref:Coatomer subunit zeta n=1 Tax=Hypsibius exemplaris TaxID=2072580 RepID=A0A1W0X708_HYPEX|nr:Coatomer subunit zeta-1 [Hypsibius exemplaris]